MMNGSKGPLLRKATALDWVGDSFDPTDYAMVHRERSYKEMLATTRNMAMSSVIISSTSLRRLCRPMRTCSATSRSTSSG